MSNDYQLIIIALLFVLFIFMATLGQDNISKYISDAKSKMYESFESFAGGVTLDEIIDQEQEQAAQAQAREPKLISTMQPVIPEQDDADFSESRAREEEFLRQKREQVKEIKLLPKELDASLNQLADRNFLISGLQVGVDSRGSSLRNPNLQLRSEPAIKKEPVSIWNVSTYQPDLTRKKLEI